MVDSNRAQMSLEQQILDTFLDELRDAVGLFNRELLMVESDASGAHTGDCVRRMLHTAHGLKGAARMVQLEPIERACHTIEDVLIALQERKLAPQLSVMQALFAVVDGMAETGKLAQRDRSLHGCGLPTLLDSLEEVVAQCLATAPDLSSVLDSTVSEVSPEVSPTTSMSAPSDADIDASLVALHRDLGRWLRARHRLPMGTDCSTVVMPFRTYQAHIACLRQCIAENLDAIMARIPLEDAGPPPANAGVANALTKAHVLVVDDSPTVRTVQRRLLEQAGHRVTTADNGAQGLERFDIEGADLIVMDIEMPVMDGYSMVQVLRQRSLHIPIVMVSCLATSDVRAQVLNLGANAFIVKSPDGYRDLLATVQRLLDEAS